MGDGVCVCVSVSQYGIIVSVSAFEKQLVPVIRSLVVLRVHSTKNTITDCGLKRHESGENSSTCNDKIRGRLRNKNTGKVPVLK